MKTILLTFSTLFSLTYVTSISPETRSKRASFGGGYSYSEGGLAYQYEPLSIPLQETPLYTLGIDTFLPIQGNSLSASKVNIAPVAYSNSVEKPVQEATDIVPQQPTGTAVIPIKPPPAVPVNAAAANVISNNGAVFLGSGALGVINLGNGAFALGSGGIGYSNQRQQPRPSGRSPLFPPLPANPNLVPSASQQPAPIPQIDLTGQISSNGFQFGGPLFTPTVPQGQLDQNGYERLNPNATSFGNPDLRVRPLKTRMSYATPTISQVTVEAGHVSQLPQSGFGDPIPRLPAQALTYV